MKVSFPCVQTVPLDTGDPNNHTGTFREMINSFSKVAGHKNQSPFSNTSDKDPKKEIRETFPITTASPQRQSETKLRVKPIQEAKDLCSKNIK